jgi:hypothetical protein
MGDGQNASVPRFDSPIDKSRTHRVPAAFRCKHFNASSIRVLFERDLVQKLGSFCNSRSGSAGWMAAPD